LRVDLDVADVDVGLGLLVKSVSTLLKRVELLVTLSAPRPCPLLLLERLALEERLPAAGVQLHIISCDIGFSLLVQDLGCHFEVALPRIVEVALKERLGEPWPVRDGINSRHRTVLPTLLLPALRWGLGISTGAVTTLIIAASVRHRIV